VKAEAGKHFEVIVKDSMDGVLHTEYFDDFDAAKRWLYRRWAGLPFHVELIDAHCAGAIYDHRESRKRIFTIDAAHLLLSEPPY
jgi:hypothetical protein